MEFLYNIALELTDLNCIFWKMVKLDEKQTLNPKLSDFEWFSEVFKSNMFDVFVWFYHSLLILEANS